ncbi:lipopolysaccharide biosynthesis protein [Clostridium perfringens]|uniref:lipopolysaccharide biosynthesis protein n=1 Tax=Clostridium perfringens TaxID=1502 RepID=UPI000BBAD57B|nr:oligosaccharide flippase family protein [Clostridium perfringens]
MDEKKRLIRNTGIIAIGNLSTKLVSFLLLPLYTSVLTTSEYGIVDYIFSISTFCVPFVTLLMEESMFRFLIDCKSQKEKEEAISLSMVLVLIGSFIFLFISIPIIYIKKYELGHFLLLYVFASALSTMISALFRGIGKTQKYATYNFFLSTFYMILNVIFIVCFHWGVKGMLSAFIISQLSVSIIYIFTNKIWRYINFSNLNYKKMNNMVRYSIPLIPNKISWSVINISDRIIIMNSLGSEAAGLYAISYKFPTLMDTVYGFFYQSWKESSARVMEDENKNIFYNKVYDKLKCFMYSVVILLTAFMPFIFKLLINDSFNKAILYVPILLLATYFSNISGFYGGIFTAYKDTKIMGVTTILAAVINLILNILLIFWVGLYAAALSTLIANIVVYIYRKIKVKKYVVLNENNKKKIKAFLVTLIVVVFLYLQNDMLSILGAFIAIIYSISENYELLEIIIKRMLRRN